MPSGYGDGSGSGSGYGSGYGYGYGSGSGDGAGCGAGYGSGSGDGAGYGGSGYGAGETIGVVGEYDVILLTPWPYVCVGCEARSIADWREHWQEIARANGVKITDAEVLQLIANINIANRRTR